MTTPDAAAPTPPEEKPRTLGGYDLGEYIKLDQFLKLAHLVQTGGEAKQRIQAGEVRVNGEVELRRGRKLRHGDVVEFDGETLVVEVE
jgi:ribosome-associated protein